MKTSTVAMFVAMAVASAEAAEVRLRSSAVCTAAVVRLADVAEIHADDARMAQSLGEIPLFPSPAAGNPKSLSQDDVRQLLALSGVERATAKVTGSETVTVTTEHATRAGSSAKRPMVASGVRQATFEAESEADRKPPRSRQATKAAPAADAKQPSTPPLAPPLVERGAVLTVTARTAGVRITTSGKALEAGAMGDTIGVELADTKQRVLASVTGPQLAEVSCGSTKNSV
jgi:hypothetical protein